MTDATTATTQTTTEATDAASGSAAPHWLGTEVDEATQGYLANKGWKNPGDMLKSYQNLEKLKGVDPSRVVEIPDVTTPFEDLGGVFQKLGKPENVDGYTLPETIKKEEAEWFLSAAHKGHLTNKQAEVLMTAYAEQAQRVAEIEKQQFEASRAADIEALKTTLGAAYESKTTEAIAAAEKLGFTKDQIEAMSWAGGYKKAMETLIGVSKKLGEGDFVGKDKGAVSTQLTPAQANAELGKLLSDPQFQALMRGEHVLNAAALNARYVELKRAADAR